MEHYVMSNALLQFFNLFFVVEPFEAILTAHGTHGHSQECLLVSTPESHMAKIRGRRLRVGKGFLARGQQVPYYQLRYLGECCKLPNRVWAGP